MKKKKGNIMRLEEVKKVEDVQTEEAEVEAIEETEAATVEAIQQTDALEIEATESEAMQAIEEIESQPLGASDTDDATKVAKRIIANANVLMRCLELPSYDKITLTNIKALSARSLKKLIDIYAMQSLKFNEDGSIVLYFPEGTFDKHKMSEVKSD